MTLQRDLLSRAIVTVTLVLMVCAMAACARNYVDIHKGLTQQQVIDRLGAPNLRATGPEGDTIWVYTDRDLRDLPMVQKENNDVTIRLRLQEKSNAFRGSTQGPYRMILKLVFDEDKRIKQYEYGTIQRRGPLPGL